MVMTVEDFVGWLEARATIEKARKEYEDMQAQKSKGGSVDGTLFIDKLSDGEIEEIVVELIKFGGIEWQSIPLEDIEARESIESLRTGFLDLYFKLKDRKVLTDEEIRKTLALGIYYIQFRCSECDPKEPWAWSEWQTIHDIEGYRRAVEHWIIRHGHIKPWEDPESLFCDTEFLRKITGKEPLKGDECRDDA